MFGWVKKGVRSVGHGFGRVGKVVIKPVTVPVAWAVEKTQEKVHMAVVSRVARYVAVAIGGALVGAGYATEAESQELVAGIVTVALILARAWYAEKATK